MRRGRVSRFVYEGALIRNHRTLSEVVHHVGRGGLEGLALAEEVSRRYTLERNLLERMEREKGLTQRVNPYVVQWLEKLGVFHA